jgi:hypothetical protein
MTTLSQDMRRSLGLVIPVWFAPDMPPDEMRAMLGRTLADSELFLDPAHLLLVVDGCAYAEAPAQQAADDFAVRAGAAPVVLCKDTNEGQGGAVCFGFEWLLEHTHLTHFASRDADGDHDLYDLPQLFRLLTQMQQIEGNDLAYVLGQRGSLHRPMGLARGEYEWLLNELTVQAVRYEMAREAAAPDLRYCQLLPQPPDFQSGYKLYTRRTAELFVRCLRDADAREPEAKVLRWGIQFVSTVELLLAGAAAGSLYRLTYDQQPQTTFEHADNRLVSYGQQFIWLFRRLQTPAAMALRWWDEATQRMLWGTTPGGWEELLAMRAHIAVTVWPGEPVPDPPTRHLMF